jgi:hypothetical protein
MYDNAQVFLVPPGCRCYGADCGMQCGHYSADLANLLLPTLALSGASHIFLWKILKKRSLTKTSPLDYDRLHIKHVSVTHIC